MTPATFLDAHAIQTLPYSNANRDENGAPKTVHYGGQERTRVSSQAWKRAIRHDVEATLGDQAVRTRRVPAKVRETLQAHGWDDELASFAADRIVADADLNFHDNDHGLTSALLYLPAAGLGDLVALCQTHRGELETAHAAASGSRPAAGRKQRATGKTKQEPVLPKEAIQAILKSRAASIDLFGRMLAEIPGGKVDGAVQVAHPFTTHASDPQPDFFTAVDDWPGDADTGSSHMQTQDYSAGVFYRYATVNLDDLITNLDGDRERAEELVRAFSDAFLYSLPQAKRTGTAPHTVPAFAYFTARAARPLSLAGAFEAPVHARAEGRARAEGHLQPSIEALAAHAKAVHRITGDRGLVARAHASLDGKPREAFGELVPTFGELIDRIVTAGFAQAGRQ